MKLNGINSPRQRYAVISDGELSNKIERLNRQFPRSGYREIQALLKTQSPPCIVQRERVRKLLSELDPEGTAQRWSAVLKRRVYSVPTPNYLWHLDSHHKLIRYLQLFVF